MPRLVDHEDRRAAIAAAACEAIAAYGLAGTTLADIGTRAGCTTGALLHYFPSKEEVVFAALGHLTARSAERISAHPNIGPAALRARLEETLPLDEERRAEWRVWVAFWGCTYGRRFEQEQAIRYASWHRSLVETLRAAAWAPPDPVETAHDLMALVDGIGIQALLNPAHWTAARQRRAVGSHLELLEVAAHR